jgi:hypothetical protein
MECKNKMKFVSNTMSCNETVHQDLEVRGIVCIVNKMRIHAAMEGVYFEPITSSKFIKSPSITSNGRFLFFGEVSFDMQNGKQIYIHKNAIETRTGSKSNELSLKGVRIK